MKVTCGTSALGAFADLLLISVCLHNLMLCRATFNFVKFNDVESILKGSDDVVQQCIQHSFRVSQDVIYFQLFTPQVVCL
jgi:hypothetical protein